MTVVLSESVPADIDRLLLGLEVKEFSVEASTLQSLQQLIQWVADLALNILAKLPDNRGMSGMNRSTGVCFSPNQSIRMHERKFLINAHLIWHSHFFSSMTSARILWL